MELIGYNPPLFEENYVGLYSIQFCKQDLFLNHY